MLFNLCKEVIISHVNIHAQDDLMVKLIGTLHFGKIELVYFIFTKTFYLIEVKYWM
jgi:hypothetical protein